MIKVSPLLCLTVVLATIVSGQLQAQSDADIRNAAEEALKVQADTVQLRDTLAKAQTAHQRGNLLMASQLYQRCWQLTGRIGLSVEPERQQVKVGLVTVQLELAREAQKRQDYQAADELIKNSLIVDPSNEEVKKIKAQNDHWLHAQEGTIPSRELREQLPVFYTNEVRIATMVQDGKLLFEAGKLDEAEAKLSQAYKEDPRNVAAHYYLELIQEKRAADATRRAELASRVGLLQVEQAWEVPLRGEQKQAPNSYARTNLVHTSIGRQNIISKLDRIRIDSVKYDGLPLGEVINNLSELAKSRDPDRTGINFFFNREVPAAAPAAGAVDPTTGLPVAAAPAEPVDITSGVTVKINPALNDVRLADVLDAITKTADKPIKYSIEDYAIVFSLKAPEPVQLYTRTFHIDPNTFRQGLESVSGIVFADVQLQNGGGSGGGSSSSGQSGGSTTIIPRVNVAGSIAGGGGGRGGGGGGIGGQGGQGTGLSLVTKSNDVAQVNQLAREFFIAAGVDLNPANPANANKSIFFNDRKGILMVHATAADIDIIAAALDTLNQTPPQVTIKSKFVEVTQNDNSALGFNWTLGNVTMGGLLGSGGTQPSFNGNNGSTFPGTIIPPSPDGLIPAANTTVPPSLTDGLITGGLRQTTIGNGVTSAAVPTIATITGILTNPQFRVAINALEQRDGVDLMTAPEVTTESGRQAEIQAVDIQAIVTGNGFNNSGSPGFAGTQSGVNSPILQQNIQIQPSTELLPFGPVLDVIPYVSADEYTIQMTIIPTVTEFIGYDPPGAFVLQAQTAGASAPITAQLPLPHFRLRQVVTSATVWDSQTIVIGGLITDNVAKVKDKVPFLGDLPLLGRLFRSESASKTKKNLMIFVTPTIINPDGTRFHSDDEMPFAQNSIPQQTPKTGTP